MKTLADAVALGGFGLGFGMVDILGNQVEFILMMFPFTAIFGAPIGEDSQEIYILIVKEGQDSVIKDVSGHKSVFAVIELGKCHFRVGVNEGLSHLLMCPHN